LRERLVEARPRAMIEEGIRDSRSRRKKRDEDCEWHDEKNQINDSGDEAGPEPGAKQRESCSRVPVRSCGLISQESLPGLVYHGRRTSFPSEMYTS
jgi:hypothetical protein